MAQNAIRFEGIDHLVLQVTDVKRSLAFYVDILGMSLERVIEDMNLYQMRCGRNLIDILAVPEGRALPEVGNRGLDHFCLNFPGGIDALIDHLKANDVQVVRGPIEVYGAAGYATSVYVQDPDGHMIELKSNYPQYPVKTTVDAFMAGLTRKEVHAGNNDPYASLFRREKP
jgi:glyoxylase I family protein